MEVEHIYGRYVKIVPDGTAAQNIVNQLRASAILESADDASVAYLEACEAMGEALITLLAHSKALAKIGPEHAFTQFYPQAVEVPVFQNPPAFKKFRITESRSTSMIRYSLQGRPMP